MSSQKEQPEKPQVCTAACSVYGVCKLVALCNPYLIFVLNQLADVVASLDHELYHNSRDKVAGTAHDKMYTF